MDILQRIIDMDKAASARVNDFVEQQRIQADETGEEAARIHSELLQKERVKVEKFRAEQEKILAEKMKASEKQRQEQIARLDGIFDSSRTAWQAEIIGRITGEQV